MGERSDAGARASGGGDRWAAAVRPSVRLPCPPTAPPGGDRTGPAEAVIDAAACDAWLSSSWRAADREHRA